MNFRCQKLDTRYHHFLTCDIADACAQCLRYPNRVVAHISVKSSRKSCICLVDILDTAIVVRDQRVLSRSFQKQSARTFAEPKRNRSVRIRIPEHIHSERYDRQCHVACPHHSLTFRSRMQNGRLNMYLLSLIKGRGVPEKNGDRLVSIQDTKFQVRWRTLIEISVLLGNLESLEKKIRGKSNRTEDDPEPTSRTTDSHRAVINCPPFYEAIQLTDQHMRIPFGAKTWVIKEFPTSDGNRVTCNEFSEKEALAQQTDLLTDATSKKFEGPKNILIPIPSSAHSSATFFQKTLRGEYKTRSLSVLWRLLSISTRSS